MKTVTYLICLLLVLLNGTTPSDASSLYGTDACHSILHYFEKNNRHYPRSPGHFQIIIADETSDNADSENEDADPSSFEATALLAPRSYVLDHILRSRAHSRSAKAYAPFIIKGAPIYIEHGVLRI